MEGQNETLPTGSVDEKFIPQLFTKMVGVVRSSNSLPQATDYAFYRTFPDFKKASSALSKRLLRTIGLVAQQLDSASEGNAMMSETDDTGRYEIVLEATDSLLEEVDLKLDEMVRRRKEALAGPAKAPGAAAEGGSSALAALLNTKVTNNNAGPRYNSATLRKPQLQFAIRVDNSLTPWVPTITHKPHARRPLQVSLAKAQRKQSNVLSPTLTSTPSADSPVPASPILSASMAQHLSVLGGASKPLSNTVLSSSSTSSFEVPPTSGHSSAQWVEHEHPYEFEISHLHYPVSQVSLCKEQLYKPLDAVPCTWVDSADQLKDLAKELDGVTEFAVDLEHHSHRTYLGITCLMQISTRTHDYLIDTLALRDQCHVLLSAFTNPAIMKVLHGAIMDIQWLQRDLGLYIVNLFDTGQAARVLELPRFSLAYLLEHYCGVTTDKKYQLADWRIRPIPEEMLLYARQDTHYLLYVADRLRNQALLSMQKHVQLDNAQPAEIAFEGRCDQPVQRVLGAILARSEAIALKRYQKPQALYQWRDALARKEDESPNYVLPNHAIFALCDQMPLTSDAILRLVAPVPPLVQVHVAALLRLIVACRSSSSTSNLPLDGAFADDSPSTLSTSAIPFVPSSSSSLSAHSSIFTPSAFSVTSSLSHGLLSTGMGPSHKGNPMMDLSSFASNNTQNFSRIITSSLPAKREAFLFDGAQLHLQQQQRQAFTPSTLGKRKKAPLDIEEEESSSSSLCSSSSSEENSEDDGKTSTKKKKASSKQTGTKAGLRTPSSRETHYLRKASKIHALFQKPGFLAKALMAPPLEKTGARASGADDGKAATSSSAAFFITNRNDPQSLASVTSISATLSTPSSLGHAFVTGSQQEEIKPFDFQHDPLEAHIAAKKAARQGARGTLPTTASSDSTQPSNLVSIGAMTKEKTALPQTLREIYQLSQQNKAALAQQKPLSGKVSSEAASNMKRQSKKVKSNLSEKVEMPSSDTQAFLKEIGWDLDAAE